MGKEKIIYSLELFLTKEGKIQGHYFRNIEDPRLEVGILKHLWAEINNLLGADLTEFPMGAKG